MTVVSPADVARGLAWLLLGAAVVGMLARWARVPYAVALVIGGLLVEASQVVAVPRIEPDLVLFLFLPPLLFDAAFRLRVRVLRLVAPPVLVLAAPGVLVTTALVGAALAAVLGLPLGVALLFGSIVAATDPVAVTAVFEQLGVSRRLSTLVEGESLVNDGMAITLYTALIGATLSGGAAPDAAALLFVEEVAVGLLVGVALGLLCSRLTRLIDDHLVEMTLSAALAYGSYLVADAAHGSGPLACVVAGLIHGSYGRRVGMSENTRGRLDDLWRFLGFAANGLLFLLVGFTVNPAGLLGHLGPVVVAVVAVFVSRAVVIALATLVSRRVLRSAAERALVVWGGLRGALTIALALALPAETPERELLAAMAFGVVLFSMVGQGLTLPLLVRRLGVGSGASGHG